MKKISLLLLTVLLLAFISLPALAEEKGNSWSKAATEVSEAAAAVGDATKESWEKGKQKTSEVWENSKDATADVAKKTSDESITLWQKLKKKIHEMTAAE